MLLHGITTAWVFLKSTDGKSLLTKTNGLSDNGLLELGHDVLGVASAEIKGLDGSKLEKISGNNTVQYSYADPLNPTVALTVNSLKMATYAKLIGLEKKGTGWQMADNKPVGGCVIKAPHLPLLTTLTSTACIGSTTPATLTGKTKTQCSRKSCQTTTRRLRLRLVHNHNRSKIAYESEQYSLRAVDKGEIR